MTALAAKFEQFDSARLQALTLLLALSSALLTSLAGLDLSGNLLLRYP